jgi:hypothetical protein
MSFLLLAIGGAAVTVMVAFVVIMTVAYSSRRNGDPDE